MIHNLQPQSSSIISVRIGVLGGTFDPPHLGHLAIAEQAIAQLELEEVNFVPARLPPHKSAKDISPVEHRVEMVRLAIAGNPRFVLSYVDVDREGPSYSVDTVRLLRQGWDESVEIYFIMGMDSLASILTWHQPDELIRLCRLAVFSRSGYGAALDELGKKLPGLRERVTFIQSPNLEISANEIQRRVRAGESIADLVPEAVADYIAEQGLYKK